MVGGLTNDFLVNVGCKIPELTDASILLPELMRADVNNETARALVDALRDPNGLSKVERILKTRDGMRHILKQYLYAGPNAEYQWNRTTSLVKIQKNPTDLTSVLRYPSVGVDGVNGTAKVWEWKCNYYKILLEGGIRITGFTKSLNWGQQMAVILTEYFFGFVDQMGLNQLRDLIRECNTYKGVPGKTVKVALAQSKKLASNGEHRMGQLMQDVVLMGGGLAHDRTGSASGEFYIMDRARQHGSHIRLAFTAIADARDDIRLTLNRYKLSHVGDPYITIATIFSELLVKAGWSQKEATQHIKLALHYDELMDGSKNGSMGFLVLQPKGSHNK
jgi:hypothetical protein